MYIILPLQALQSAARIDTIMSLLCLKNDILLNLKYQYMKHITLHRYLTVSKLTPTNWKTSF